MFKSTFAYFDKSLTKFNRYLIGQLCTHKSTTKIAKHLTKGHFCKIP